MKRTRSLFLLSLLLLSILFSVHAQTTPAPWTGIIAPTRAADWRAAGVPNGIPSRTTVCATMTPANTAAQINAAIASCPSGQVVSLAAGTYNLTSSIDFLGHSNVTLRGAGADQTKLYFSGTEGCYVGFNAGICVEPHYVTYIGDTYSTAYADWTVGYGQNSNAITLSNTTGLSVGSVITLDQCDDGFSGSGATGGSSGCSTGSATDTGQVWNCSAAGICSSGGPGGAARPNRSQQQQVTVTAINGSTVSISPGIYMSNWRSSQSPGAFWPTSLPLSRAGVEDLSVDMAGSTANPGGATGILLDVCYGCWVTGTRTVNTARNHMWLYMSSHDTIANNYLYGTQNSTDESYGIESYIGSDNLIMNNIAQHIVSPTISGGADEGNVVAYNYALDDYFSSAGWFMPANWLHAAGSAMNLFEGNQGPGFNSDNEHGTHNLTTLFRNYEIGNQTACYGTPCTNQLAPLILHYSRYFNVIGNVLGSSRYTNYSSYPTSGTQSNGTATNATIYTIGWSGNNAYASSVGLNDFPMGSGSLMLWGNYDVASAAVKWNLSEVPTKLTDTTGSTSIYAFPFTPSQALPPSFFITGAQPSWWATPWGTPAWPAIGPDVTGGNIPGLGGYANNIPAELCYANTPLDASYQQTYPVTAANWSSGKVTLSVATGTIAQGEITVSGVNPSGYNGTFPITASTSSSVSYALATNPGLFVSGGTMQYPNVRLFNAKNCYGQSAPAQQPQPPTGVTGTVTTKPS